MALPPATSPGDASPPSQSPSRTSFPFRQRLWPFSHAKPPSSEPPPKAPIRTAYVPQHAAADFLRTTTPKPRVLPTQEQGSPYRQGEDEKMDDFSLFVSQAQAADLVHRPHRSARSQEESSRQSRNQGGVVRRIADYVKPPRDG